MLTQHGMDLASHRDTVKTAMALLKEQLEAERRKTEAANRKTEAAHRKTEAAHRKTEAQHRQMLAVAQIMLQEGKTIKFVVEATGLRSETVQDLSEED